MDSMLIVVIIAVTIALIFDVINGFHDAANSIATVVSTGVLSPRFAVLWAAFFNFIAMFIFVPKVADTISKIIDIDPTDFVFLYVVMMGLIGAIFWNLLTWYLGLPSSSSHALLGGLAGAGIAYKGFGIINWHKLEEAIMFIPLAPIIGAVGGFIFMIALYWIFRRWKPYKVDKLFRKGQLVSAALYSLGHGGNDAQKTMGIIIAILVSTGYYSKDVVLSLTDFSTSWIIFSCHIAMGIGTIFGGWRIVKTMGLKITKLKPIHGFVAETSGALTLFLATTLGIPVSTTHTISGSIVGVGATTSLAGIKWSIAGKIVIAWFVTIPLSAIVAAVCFWIVQFFHPGF